MYCPKCGKPCEDTQPFCGNCGAKLSPLKSVEDHKAQKPEDRSKDHFAAHELTLGGKTIHAKYLFFLGVILEFIGMLAPSVYKPASYSEFGILFFSIGGEDPAQSWSIIISIGGIIALITLIILLVLYYTQDGFFKWMLLINSIVCLVNLVYSCINALMMGGNISVGFVLTIIGLILLITCFVAYGIKQDV